MADKREIRRQVLALRDAMTAGEIEEKSGAVTERLTGMAEVRRAGTLMVFLAFASEVNLDGLLRWGWGQGKRMVVPRCLPAERHLNACRIDSFGELGPGFYGIRAPREDELRPVPEAEIDAIIVPAVAFDRRGYRIGYGGGYYDRFLKRTGRAVRIGAVFACQLVAAVPEEPHDVPVDGIVTEGETIFPILSRFVLDRGAGSGQDAGHFILTRGEMEENTVRGEEESGEEKSFAELFAASEPERGRLKPGERIEAVIVKISPEWVFIDLGGKHEGYLDRKEFVDKEGQLTVQEGQTIRAYFLSSRNNEKLFTTRVAAGDAGRAILEDAWRGGVPVEGHVEREVKGGFEVKLAGDTRAFCPFSQMGLYRITNAADWVGQRLSFKIIEFSERGRNIIVSHRSILAEEQAKVREQLKETLQVGMLVKGTIVSLQKFGAFVDLGGIQGLIPISEVAWEHIGDIKERLSVGQEVEAVILKLDWEANKISLSLRSNLPDPWEQAVQDYPEGSTLTGRVARLTKFGAFVTLMPGVDGLIHISRIGRGKRISHPSEVLTEGQAITVKVEKIDREAKRVSLVPVAEVEEEQAEAIEDYQQYVGKAPGSFGSLGDTLRRSGDERQKRR